MNEPEVSTLLNEQIVIQDFLARESRKEIISEIFAGLSANQKFISSRFFYDAAGSWLFESITKLSEYYPTRTEKSILKNCASALLPEIKDLDIIELGSGDCSKISILLDAIPEQHLETIHYYPVDVSQSAILKSARELSRRFPEIRIAGLLADFMKHLHELPGPRNRLICFFGSTLGNFTRTQGIGYVKGLREIMRPGDVLLLGLDMVKDEKILEAAYNDGQGITAAFNRNILHVTNQTARTNFIPEYFEHRAFYNREKDRIEMHLIANRDMEVVSPCFHQEISLKKGETIHTENSHKFTPGHIREMGTTAGFEVKNIWKDPDGWFSLVQFEVPH